MGLALSQTRMIKLLILGAACVAVSYGLTCTCGASPCQTPECCESGQYTLDACGCCLTCAKDDGQKCGGPFRVEGRCAGGLRCLRKCECKSTRGTTSCFPSHSRVRLTTSAPPLAQTTAPPGAPPR